MRYRDRQPAALLLTLAGFLAIGNAIAIGAIYGPVVRLVVGLLGLTVVAAVGIKTLMHVEITEEAFRVDSARLPFSAVRRIEVLQGEEFRRALRLDAHPNDYLRIRSTNAGVRLFLDDPKDPHRAWVVSIRDPQAVASVLERLGVGDVHAG